MSSARVVMITGAGRGIGAAVAHAFAATGDAVFLVSRTAEELRSVADSVRSSAAGVACWPADVSAAGAAAEATQRCVAMLGPPDVLVNAAGVYGPIGRSWEVDAAEWWRSQEINVLGTLLACQAVLPIMIGRGSGRVINFSGGGATAPLPRFSAYAAAKAAVVRLTETLAEELREHAITVNAIAPGAVDTRLQDDVLRAGERAGPLYDRIRALRATGAGGVPAALSASLAVFLASDAAALLTGKLISAPHDDWSSWDDERVQQLSAGAWLTLRRLDEFTLQSLPPLRAGTHPSGRTSGDGAPQEADA
jgi:NAD(P)-dependent dehydrogenase (short-subunit alcohol dehydrogenase family)